MKPDSRFMQIGILCAVLLLGIGIGYAFHAAWTPQVHTSPKSVEITHEATTSSVLGDEHYGEMGEVARVIDGDTIELMDGRKVRYIGIDTPEVAHPQKGVECFGKEASEENKRLVLGKKVRLEKDISDTDRFGRFLRYVYIEEVMVNEVLVQTGFAYASSYPPDVKYQEQLREAQRIAEEKSNGLWETCSLSPTPKKALNVFMENTSPTSIPEQTGCIIKGNISTSGEKIYHVTGCGSYNQTSIDEAKGEWWFCTEEDAVANGFRKAKNC